VAQLARLPTQKHPRFYTTSTLNGHQRLIKSNGLSQAGSIERMSADCARRKPSAGLIDCISKARSTAQPRENPLGWAAERFPTHQLATAFVFDSGDTVFGKIGTRGYASIPTRT
jgi:hypothetical protein